MDCLFNKYFNSSSLLFVLITPRWESFFWVEEKYMEALILFTLKLGCMQYRHRTTGIILGMSSANERKHYIVTSSLTGWACCNHNGPDYQPLNKTWNWTQLLPPEEISCSSTRNTRVIELAAEKHCTIPFKAMWQYVMNWDNNLKFYFVLFSNINKDSQTEI